jgi:hypothetical protein
MGRLYPVLLLFSVYVVGCVVSPPPKEQPIGLTKNPGTVQDSATLQPEPIQRTPEQIKKSVVRIRAEDKMEGTKREGTGFVVGVSDDKAYIITVSHVIEGDPKPTIEFWGDKEFKAKVLDSEPQKNGLALLSVEGRIPYDAIPLYLVKKRELNSGDAVFTFGFPRGGAPWTYDALSYSGQKLRNLQFSESDIGEGNSGCPVIKGDQVVAVVTSVTNYAFAVPTESIREFLRGAKGGETILHEMENWDVTTWHKEYEVRLEKARQIEYADKPRRVALVIGNTEYSAAPMANAINDAKDMSKALKNVGFKVISYENVSQQTMEVAIHTFRRTLSKNTIALFYYSGYGIQYEGKNYLIPIDAEVFSSSPDALIRESVEVEYVVAEMTQAATTMNIVLLDASHPNHFYESFYKGFASGLSPMLPTEGLLIAYATSPSKVVVESKERNSFFTKHLLRIITQQPDLPIEPILMQVHQAVRKETDGKQLPWYSSSLDGEFYFAEKRLEPPGDLPYKVNAKESEPGNLPYERERDFFMMPPF